MLAVITGRDAPRQGYVNDYCFAYEVSDGQVIAIREYMDTRGGWRQVFGGEDSQVLLEGSHRTPDASPARLSVRRGRDSNPRWSLIPILA